MSGPRGLAAIALLALAGSVLSGLGVHAVREGPMGLERSEQMTIENLGDLLRAAAWETRVALADLTFLEASMVFHRGLRDASELGLEPSPLRPWVPEHRHDLEGAAEMMPWIWITAALNPNHTRAYAMGGYFLARILDQPEQGLEFLAQGEANNPDDGLIPLTLGRIRLTRMSDAEGAIAPLTRAVEHEIEDEEEMLSAVRYLAHALRIVGRWEEGVTLWEEQARTHADDEAYQHGMEIYLRLIEDEESRTSYTFARMESEDLAAIEDLLCDISDTDHQDDDNH